MQDINLNLRARRAAHIALISDDTQWMPGAGNADGASSADNKIAARRRGRAFERAVGKLGSNLPRRSGN